MGGTHVWRGVRIGLVVLLGALPGLAQEGRLPLLPGEGAQLEELRGVLRDGTVGARAGAPPPRTVTPPGAYALSIDDAFDLGGFVFRDGSPFLHNDGGALFSNTALGVDALISSTPGVPSYYNGATNTAVGALALRDNTTGFQNTGSGASALLFNSTGSRNTANGAYALEFNTTGDLNTGVGALALVLNTTGFYNTASGALALSSNTTGRANTANGTNALIGNTTGSLNTASGAYALLSNTTGNLNTASGTGALQLNSTGSRNTALGYFAGFANSTGTDNILIASYGANESNTLRIGEGTGTGIFEQSRAFISGIRGITTGSANAIPVLIDSSGQLGTISSSRRFKEEIRDMGEASAGLAELRPVTFRYKRAFENGDKPMRYGLIAEEVAEVFPDLVAYDADGRPEAILDHLLVPLLLNEIQKRQRESVAQAETIARLEASHEALLLRLQRLEAVAAKAIPPVAQPRAAPAP